MSAPKTKATIYATDVFGELFSLEVRLEAHGRSLDGCAGNQKGMGPAPFVHYVEPPRRRITYLHRTDYTGRYLLILEGWGYPNPKPVKVHGNSHSDPSLLYDWDESVNDKIDTGEVKLLGDYRDLTKPDYLIRKDCAHDLHCLDHKPEQASEVINTYEALTLENDCQDPEYWAMIRDQYSASLIHCIDGVEPGDAICCPDSYFESFVEDSLARRTAEIDALKSDLESATVAVRKSQLALRRLVRRADMVLDLDSSHWSHRPEEIRRLIEAVKSVG